MTQPPAKKEATKVETAVLSTTAKANARAKTKKAADGDAMDTDEKPTEPLAEKSEDAPVKEKKAAEPTSHPVQNLTRVTPAQLAHISFSSNSRYSLARPASAPKKGKKVAAGNDYARKSSMAVGGIVVLSDNDAEAQGEFVELKQSLWTAPAAAPATATAAPAQDATMSSGDDFEEAEPPAPFEVSDRFSVETTADLTVPLWRGLDR